jgi:hypothetical protein
MSFGLDDLLDLVGALVQAFFAGFHVDSGDGNVPVEAILSDSRF